MLKEWKVDWEEVFVDVKKISYENKYIGNKMAK